MPAIALAISAAEGYRTRILDGSTPLPSRPTPAPPAAVAKPAAPARETVLVLFHGKGIRWREADGEIRVAARYTEASLPAALIAGGIARDLIARRGSRRAMDFVGKVDYAPPPLSPGDPQLVDLDALT